MAKPITRKTVDDWMQLKISIVNNKPALTEAQQAEVIEAMTVIDKILLTILRQ